MSDPTIAGLLLKMIDREEVLLLGHRSFKRCTNYSGDKNENVYKEGFYDGFRDAMNRLDHLIKMQRKDK